jgi:biofilm PGA synthesis N-glycosyltransferase PgaC
MLLFFINLAKQAFKKNKKYPISRKLPVTLIITACNEEDVLEQKIENTLALDYPADKLKIIFITDGSSDGSVNIINKYSAITLLHQYERRGKLAAIKRAMNFVETPVVIFSDANTMLNKESIYQIARHYSDPNIGGVAGEKKILLNSKVSAVGQAEGLYWQYESLMKKLDANFNTAVGAAGELFSIRTELFREIEDEVILDDFMISMQVCLQGYKISYEPKAFAIESPSVSLFEEEKRKIRIAAGAYQSIGYLWQSLNVFKFPLLCFQFFSRRILRWIASPMMLIVLFFSNFIIVNKPPDTYLYLILLFAQLAFYLLAFIGWLFISSGRRAGIVSIPFYFVFMNYCLLKGFIKFLKGQQTVLWDKSLRQAME